MMQDLQTKLNQARKAGDKVAMSMLQVVLGDLSTLKARNNKEPTEDQIENLIRSIRDKNIEALSMISGKEPDEGGNLLAYRAKLGKENEYLSSLLPTTLTVDEITVELIEVVRTIKTCKSAGQATGVAMKFLKSKGLKVLGDDVKVAAEGLFTVNVSDILRTAVEHPEIINDEIDQEVLADLKKAKGA